MDTRPKPSFAFKLVELLPTLRGIPALVTGMCVRPEHIHTPDAGRYV